MYRIIDKKCSGKTARLMQLAKDNNAIVVCSNPDAFKYKAQAYGITGVRFIDYYTYLSSAFNWSGKNILIDEIDGLMKALPGNPIGYCLSEDD